MDQPIAVRGLQLRRALSGVLLEAGRPLTIGEVVAALRMAGVVLMPWHAKPMHMVIADMLAYQIRTGRVRRTARATYEVIPSSMSRSTQWRCRHWHDGLLQ